jgi:hypothetical protein
MKKALFVIIALLSLFAMSAQAVEPANESAVPNASAPSDTSTEEKASGASQFGGFLGRFIPASVVSKFSPSDEPAKDATATKESVPAETPKEQKPTGSSSFGKFLGKVLAVPVAAIKSTSVSAFHGAATMASDFGHGFMSGIHNEDSQVSSSEDATVASTPTEVAELPAPSVVIPVVSESLAVPAVKSAQPRKPTMKVAALTQPRRTTDKVSP